MKNLLAVPFLCGALYLICLVLVYFGVLPDRIFWPIYIVLAIVFTVTLFFGLLRSMK